VGHDEREVKATWKQGTMTDTNSFRTPALLLAPSALVFIATFAVPFVLFFAISFWELDLYDIKPAFKFGNYAEVKDKYLGITAFTIFLSALVGVFTTAIGFLYAYVARFKLPKLSDLMLFLALLTMFGGYLMKVYSWKTILGNEGVINTALLGIGLIDEPIAAFLYSPGAVAITLLHFSVPFAILPIHAAMRGIRDIEIEAAQDLGASKMQQLTTVILPRSRVAIVIAFTLAFLITVGDYVTPLLVGGKQQMLGNFIAPQFGSLFNWPLGAAMSFVLLLFSAVTIILFERITAWWLRP
jgi:spermidine/putrescine transport system permease protein